jgi:hypothetical protein
MSWGVGTLVIMFYFLLLFCLDRIHRLFDRNGRLEMSDISLIVRLVEFALEPSHQMSQIREGVIMEE